MASTDETLAGELRGYLAHHDEGWGARGEHLSVHVDYGDLSDWAERVEALEAENAALRAVGTRQIALAQYADQDFGEEVGFMFLAEPPEHTAWHFKYAAELLAERLTEALAAPDAGAGQETGGKQDGHVGR